MLFNFMPDIRKAIYITNAIEHLNNVLLLSLRREDLDARFPRLLDALLGAVENDALTHESTTKNLPPLPSE